jgi:hypothetical protein
MIGRPGGIILSMLIPQLNIFVAPTDPVDEFLEVYESSLGHISNCFLLRGVVQ